MDEQNSQYYQVRCNLCGENQPTILFEIDGNSPEMLSVLKNGHEGQVDVATRVVQCGRCGLVYVNPRIQLETGIMPYSTEAEDAYFKATFIQRSYACQRLVTHFSKWYGATPSKVLDIGCGDGVMLDACENAGIDFIGTELSLKLVEQLRSRYGERVSDAQDLNTFSAESFDVVTMINVIEHLEDPRQVVSQVWRILKPGGIFLVHAPNMAGLPARFKGKGWHHIQPLVHLYYFTPATLRLLLQKVGFKPIGRFSMLSPSPMKRAFQIFSDRFQIYLDNGLGIVARRE